MAVRRIAFKDFEARRQMWGLPKILNPTLSMYRTVWQMWNREGRGYDTVHIVYPKGGYAIVPVPQKNQPVLYEERVSHLQLMPEHFRADYLPEQSYGEEILDL